MLIDLTYELCLQGTIAGFTQFLEFCLAKRIALPLGCGTFVAANVEVWVREDGAQLGDDVLGELHGSRISHVEHILADTTGYPNFRRTFGMTAEFRIGMQSGNEMTRHVNLGQDVNVALSSIANNVLHLLLSVVEWTVFAVGLCT